MSTPYVGEIRMFGFPRIPVGWVACNGSLLSIAEYQVLFTLIGTTYGGDGVMTFAVPDLRGQVPVHQGQGPGLSPYVIGQRSGSNEITLLTAQMPSHSHAFNVTTAAASSNSPTALQPGSLSADTTYVTDIQGAAGVQFAPQMIQIAGGSQPHPNCMPTLTVSFCIAIEGVYPSQN